MINGSSRLPVEWSFNGPLWSRPSPIPYNRPVRCIGPVGERFAVCWMRMHVARLGSAWTRPEIGSCESKCSFDSVSLYFCSTSVQLGLLTTSRSQPRVRIGITFISSTRDLSICHLRIWHFVGFPLSRTLPHERGQGSIMGSSCCAIEGITAYGII